MLAFYFDHLFPPTEIAVKIAVALGVGILVGLEREWAQKDVGVRTFAITAMLGLLAQMLGTSFAIAAVIGTFILVICLNLRAVLVNRSLEITTSASLMVVVLLGILTGRGHTFTPVASAIIVTLLLTWKTPLTRFAGGLTPQEIRSAVLLGLLGLVIYPLLPNRFVDPWQMLNPRQAWITVIVLAGIGFVNYVFLRIYSNRGLYYTAVLGGLVNSTVVAAELARWIRPGEGQTVASGLALILLSRIAMFLRNLAILLIFAPVAASAAMWPLLGMAVVASAVVWFGGKKDKAPEHPLSLSSPMSLLRVFKMGLLFVGIQVACSLAERHVGHLGFLIVSFAGGLFSSASTTASVALMASNGIIAPRLAGAAVVLTSVSSALVSLPLIYQQTRHRELSRSMAMFLMLVVLFGLGILLLTQKVLH